MQPNKSKATLQLVIATLLSLFGMLLLGAAFVTAPPGEIHSSVLSPLLPSILHPIATLHRLAILNPIATLHRLAILNRYIRTSPRPTASPLHSTSIYAPRTTSCRTL